MSTELNPSFSRGIMLKVAFHPETLRRCQAAILYRALMGGEFTADEVLVGELVGEDTKVSGCAVGSLASIGLIICTGRRKAGSASRNGAKTNVWALAEGKRHLAELFLSRNHFPDHVEVQTEIAV